MQLETMMLNLASLRLCCRHALHCLELTLHRINDDIDRKTNSLHIDRQCLASRDKLTHAHLPTQVERNQRLVGATCNKPPVLPY